MVGWRKRKIVVVPKVRVVTLTPGMSQPPSIKGLTLMGFLDFLREAMADTPSMLELLDTLVSEG